MIRYLLDTNIVSEPVQRDPNANLMEALKDHAIDSAISTITLQEMIYGVERLAEGTKRRYLQGYIEHVLASFPILSYTPEAAEWHAKEQARLEMEGKKRPFVDGMIAAIASTNNLVLVTRNTPDFAFYRDLIVENWYEAAVEGLSLEELQAYLKRPDSITGKPFIRDAVMRTPTHAVIQYYYDYEEYTRENPGNLLNESTYDNYFGTNDQIQKLLMRDSVRILRNIPIVNTITFILPFNEQLHAVDFERKEIEDYFKISLQELHDVPEKWRSWINQVYSKGEREKFIKRFARTMPFK